jgi:hypothetical protein
VGGSTTNSPAPAGATVTVVADEPDDGKAFVQWQVDGSVNITDAGASTATFVMPDNAVTVTAVFAEILIEGLDPNGYPWTGEAVEPDFRVSLDGVGMALVPGTDYTASFTNNVDPGTATLSVTLGNGRTGSQSAEFTILPPPPAITNVSATAGAPWNGKVTLTFDVENNAGAVCPDWNQPYLSIVATDNVTCSNYVSVASALTADAAALAGSNGTHEVVWDMAAQGIDFSSTNVTFTVAYLKMPDYCVIDLSGGTNAESFAVSYLDAEPEGGFTNDLYKTDRLAMRLLAPATFKMNKRYEHTLTRPFYCAVFETTQRQWELVAGDNPSSTNGAGCAALPVEQVSYADIRGPSLGVQWPTNSEVDATSFLGVLRQKTGLFSLDLPTEAQWEYACRAGTTTHFSYGDNADGNYMWYDENSGGMSHEVGTKKPNPWGFYDMHGNVFEWCLDWFGSRLQNGVTDYPGPSEPQFGGLVYFGRVRRGGAARGVNPSLCRSSTRDNFDPSGRDYNGGFRLFRTLTGDAAAERAGEAFDGLPRPGTVCAGSTTTTTGLQPFAPTDIVLAGCTNEYDGIAHHIGVTTNGAIEGLTLRYCAVDGSLGELAPPQFSILNSQFSISEPPQFVNVTNVMVFVEASAPGYFTTTNGAPVVITKAANAWVTEPSMAGWTVGATPATPNKGQAKFGTATVAYGVAGGAAGGLGATRPSAAGSYVATFTVPGTANYGGLVKNVSFTIATAPTPPKPTPPAPKTYTVKFDANGGKGGTTAKKTAGAALKAPSVTRAGYKLKGWTPAVPAKMPAANVTYKAVWTPLTYTVKFAANGGTLPKGKAMAAQTMTVDKAGNLRANVFTRTDWVFAGWAKTKNGPVAYKNGQSVKNIAKAGQTVTLYAVWAKPTYKVVFNASGGRLPRGVKAPTQKFTYGKSQKLADNRFVRDGYVFGGWAIRDPLATVPKIYYRNGQVVKNLSPDGRTVVLYAVWKKR